MAEYLLDDIIGPAPVKQVQDLAAAFSKLTEEITRLVNLNELSDDQMANLATKLKLVETASKKLQQTQAQAAAQASREQREKEKQALAEERLAAAKNKTSQAEARATELKTRAALAEQRLADARDRAFRREENIRTRKSKLTIQERTDLQALNAVEKLKATIASQHTTELQKQAAQLRLLGIEIQQIIKTQGTENQLYRDKMALLGKLTTEYQGLQQASGQLQVANLGLYGPTFQLTQVMRELPNFAIDARVGFMSLSNNLPMLATGFQQLANSVDATGKKLGSLGALKAFAASLLSINTIFVLLSTALIAYGDQLAGAFRRKTDVATEGLRAFVKELREANGEVATAQETLYRMTAVMEATTLGFYDQAKALKIYNNEYEDILGKADSFNEAQNILAAKSPAIIQAYSMQAYAQALLTESVASYGRAFALQANDEIKWYSRIQESIRETFAWRNIWMMQEGTGIRSGESGQDYVLRKRNERAEKEIARAEEGIERYKAAMLDLAEFMQKEGVDLWSSLMGSSGRDKVIQQGTDILVALDTYSKERLDVLNRQRDAELRVQETLVNGELNSFEERRKAAQEFHDTTVELARLDLEVSRANATEETRVALERIANTRDKNDRLFKEGKVSAERHKELTEQYAVAERTLQENLNGDLLKINDDYMVKSREAWIRYNKDILDINSDAADRDIIVVEEHLSRRLAALDIAEREARSRLNRGDFLSGLTGFNRDTEVESLQLQQEFNRERLQSQKDALQWQLDNLELSGKERLAIEDNIRKLSLEQDIQFQKDQTSIQEAILKERQDLEVEAAKQTVELIGAIWDAYYAKQLQQIQEQKDKYKIIEDERMADIADREKAGVITKEEAEEEKARMQDYYQSIQDDLDRQRKEKEKNQFLWEQAAALAKVWVNWGIAVSSPANLAALGTLTPLYTAIALLSTGTIAAQTIPHFAEGGTMKESGLAVLGDGGKHEVVRTPEGKFFLTPDEPGLFHLKAGSKIFPDADKMHMAGVLGSGVHVLHSSNEELLREIKGMRRDMARRRPYNTSMPVLKQIEFGRQFNARRAGL